MNETKTCPYCAEEIRSEAVFCRYCRSRLQATVADEWYRNHPEARLGGVCAALAHAFAVPIVAVRLAFVVFTVFLHIGVLVYAGLWILIPPSPGEPSHAERALQWAIDALHGKQCSHRRECRADPQDRPLAGGGSCHPRA